MNEAGEMTGILGDFCRLVFEDKIHWDIKKALRESGRQWALPDRNCYSRRLFPVSIPALVALTGFFAETC